MMGFWMMGFWILDDGILDFGFWILDFGSQKLEWRQRSRLWQDAVLWSDAVCLRSRHLEDVVW
jgi:hypothetical protein